MWKLDRHPTLDTLHPGLRGRLQTSNTYLAVPCSVAYADDVLFIYDRLNATAAHVEGQDAAFARYLRLRARDLLADNYEGGDAAWVTSRLTGNLNAHIGTYETYDDAPYGVKTFFSLSLLVRDRRRSDELQAALADIQEVEDALPYAPHGRVRSDIPVGVYNIVADFGQARGANTATILPNEAYLARQDGRTILMRGNILLNQELSSRARAAVAGVGRSAGSSRRRRIFRTTEGSESCARTTIAVSHRRHVSASRKKTRRSSCAHVDLRWRLRVGATSVETAGSAVEVIGTAGGCASWVGRACALQLTP